MKRGLLTFLALLIIAAPTHGDTRTLHILSKASADTFYCQIVGGAGCTMNLGASIIFRGATSGTSTVVPPAIAGSATITLPNASSTLPIFTQQITFAGATAARTWTGIDTSDTFAFLGAANAFTGGNTLAGDTTLGAASKLQWGSAGVTSPDLVLVRDTTDRLAIKRGTNGTGLRIYNSDDGAGNTSSIAIAASAGAAVIQTSLAGSGAAMQMTIGPSVAAALNFQTNNTQRGTIDSNGNFLYTGGLVNDVGSTFRVTADFTDASSTALQTITGLSWVLPLNTATTYTFRCEILYSQATAAVSDTFGIQAASLAPTNIMAKGDVATSAAVVAFGNLPTLNTTTATSFVTFTPSAITTVWNARFAGMIENPSGVANTINIMVSQSTAANLITIKRGSYCTVGT